MKTSMKDLRNLLDLITLDKLRFKLLDGPEDRVRLRCSLEGLELGQGEIPGFMIGNLRFFLDAPFEGFEDEASGMKDAVPPGPAGEEPAVPVNAEDAPVAGGFPPDTTFRLEDLSLLLSERWLNSPSSARFFKSLDLSLNFRFREGGRIHVSGFYKIFPFSADVVLSLRGPWQLAVRVENISLLFLLLIPNFLTDFIMGRMKKHIQGEGLTLRGREVTVDLEKMTPAKLEGALLEADVNDGFFYVLAGSAEEGKLSEASPPEPSSSQ
jgi:hypothetical protein